MREIVVLDLPQEPAQPLRQLGHAAHGHRLARGRNGDLPGIPRPSGTLVRHSGSLGSIVSVGVTMAPRVPRAMPHGRPATGVAVIVRPPNGTIARPRSASRTPTTGASSAIAYSQRMPRRFCVGICLAVAAGVGCRRPPPPGGESVADRATVVYDLARSAHAADAAFPQPFLAFGTPLTGANEDSGFLSMMPGLNPATSVEATSALRLRWPRPIERLAVLDLEPAAGVSRGTLRVSLGGRELATLPVRDGRGRYAVRIPIDAQNSKGGHLELSFEAGPPAARDGSAFAARLYSLALGPATDPWLKQLAEPDSRPALEVVEGKGVPALVQSGPSRLTYALRVPEGARLVFRARPARSGQRAAFRVSLGSSAGQRELWSSGADGDEAGAETSIALPKAGGELDLLTLEVSSADGSPTWGIWEAPRVLGTTSGPPPRATEASELARVRAALSDANVVLVVLDAGSAKHFGCYGYGKPTTPEVDRIASESVLFERAHSPAPNTRVAMASLWTSQYPDENGSGFNTRRRLPAERLRLAQILSGHGVHTAGFVANANAEPGLGYELGFQEYHRLYHGSGLVAAEAFRPLLDRFFSEAATRGRFFLYVHYKEPHVPYDPPPPFPSMFLPPGARPVSAGRAMRFVR